MRDLYGWSGLRGCGSTWPGAMHWSRSRPYRSRSIRPQRSSGSSHALGQALLLAGLGDLMEAQTGTGASCAHR